MIFKIHKVYLILTLILLVIEIGIAYFFSDGFIRHTLGDYLVVILLYCGIRSFIKVSPIYIAFFVLLFAFIVEFSQLFNVLDYFNLRDHKIATIILGSTFHVSDLIAYTLGTMTISVLDLKTSPWTP